MAVSQSISRRMTSTMLETPAEYTRGPASYQSQSLMTYVSANNQLSREEVDPQLHQSITCFPHYRRSFLKHSIQLFLFPITLLYISSKCV
jgi:hypothetical protein